MKNFTLHFRQVQFQFSAKTSMHEFSTKMSSIENQSESVAAESCYDNKAYLESIDEEETPPPSAADDESASWGLYDAPPPPVPVEGHVPSRDAPHDVYVNGEASRNIQAAKPEAVVSETITDRSQDSKPEDVRDTEGRTTMTSRVPPSNNPFVVATSDSYDVPRNLTSSREGLNLATQNDGHLANAISNNNLGSATTSAAEPESLNNATSLANGSDSTGNVNSGAIGTASPAGVTEGSRDEAGATVPAGGGTVPVITVFSDGNEVPSMDSQLYQEPRTATREPRYEPSRRELRASRLESDHTYQELPPPNLLDVQLREEPRRQAAHVRLTTESAIYSSIPSHVTTMSFLAGSQLALIPEARGEAASSHSRRHNPLYSLHGSGDDRAQTGGKEGSCCSTCRTSLACRQWPLYLLVITAIIAVLNTVFIGLIICGVLKHGDKSSSESMPAQPVVEVTVGGVEHTLDALSARLNASLRETSKLKTELRTLNDSVVSTSLALHTTLAQLQRNVSSLEDELGAQNATSRNATGPGVAFNQTALAFSNQLIVMYNTSQELSQRLMAVEALHGFNGSSAPPQPGGARYASPLDYSRCVYADVPVVASATVEFQDTYKFPAYQNQGTPGTKWQVLSATCTTHNAKYWELHCYYKGNKSCHQQPADQQEYYCRCYGDKENGSGRMICRMYAFMCPLSKT